MTKKPKTRERRARCITEAEAAEAAAFDFEPWQGEVETKKLPDNEQFTEAGLSHLIFCRVALLTMYKTKAELIEMFEPAGSMRDILDGMIAAHKFFSHFLTLVDSASARLVIAGSNHLQRHGGFSRLAASPRPRQIRP